jgi:hypothetical protein
LKAEITKHGVEIYAESEAESWALRGVFPVEFNDQEILSRIVIHTDPHDLRMREEDA